MPGQERLGMAIPSGELKEDVVGFLHQDASTRKPVIPVENMTVDLFIVRASMILFLTGVKTRAKVGITGSDLTWEY